jgi:hypothetical protein
MKEKLLQTINQLIPQIDKVLKKKKIRTADTAEALDFIALLNKISIIKKEKILRSDDAFLIFLSLAEILFISLNYLIKHELIDETIKRTLYEIYAKLNWCSNQIFGQKDTGFYFTTSTNFTNDAITNETVIPTIKNMAYLNLTHNYLLETQQLYTEKNRTKKISVAEKILFYRFTFLILSTYNNNNIISGYRIIKDHVNVLPDSYEVNYQTCIDSIKSLYEKNLLALKETPYQGFFVAALHSLTTQLDSISNLEQFISLIPRFISQALAIIAASPYKIKFELCNLVDLFMLDTIGIIFNLSEHPILKTVKDNVSSLYSNIANAGIPILAWQRHCTNIKLAWEKLVITINQPNVSSDLFSSSLAAMIPKTMQLQYAQNEQLRRSSSPIHNKSNYKDGTIEIHIKEEFAVPMLLSLTC